MKRISLLNPIKTIINTVKGLFHEVPRKAVDYSRAENWAFLADTTGAEAENPPADVFFISPTACLGRYEPYFLDLSDQKEKAALAKVIRMEKGIYDKHSRFFAPYYRQAGFEVYSFGDEFREECLRDAHEDVEDAFDYYMAHYNEGRPIIIAGFSQGADHVLRLLKAHAADERVTSRLIAAYAIGWTITTEEMARYPQLRFAGRADDTGVIVAFNSEAENVTDSPILPKGVHALTGAYIDTRRGALKCTDIGPGDFPGKLYDDGIFHIYDYRFFYRNLQENVSVRIDAYLKEHGKPHKAA